LALDSNHSPGSDQSRKQRIMRRLPRTGSITLAALLATSLANAQTHKTPAKPTDWQIEGQVQQALHDQAFQGSSIGV